MAVLGFILGLGFLIPVGTDESREPASVQEEPRIFFHDPKRPSVSPVAIKGEGTDPRKNVLFDIHTISSSKYAKDTDAWVQLWSQSDTEIDSVVAVSYCHNYDYNKQAADTSLDRYATTGPKAYNCYQIGLNDLPSGTSLIDTDFGSVLSLKSSDFDPKTGGTLSLIFAYRVNVLQKVSSSFSNDYRALTLKVKIGNGVASITGPNGETFDWLNLTMHEFIGLPNGIEGFETLFKSQKVGTYRGKDFPRLKK